MSNKFTCADLHLGHKNIIDFTYPNSDQRFRPFESVQEHDQILIDNWNKVVSPNDTTYLLGDAVFGKKNLPLLDQLNGKKKLIMGNHDIYGWQEYSKYFYDMVSCRTIYKPCKMIMTHIPVHTSQIGRWKLNICGHLHTQQVLLENGEPDPRYICVSMEQINFTPISFEDLFKIVETRLEINEI
jgi:calcineurin-like phosphoesterase family protein